MEENFELGPVLKASIKRAVFYKKNQVRVNGTTVEITKYIEWKVLLIIHWQLGDS